VKRLFRMLLIGAAVLTLTACTASTVVAGPKVAPVAKAATYVAIGGDDSIGAGSDDPLLDAWTQVFFRTALPRSTVFLNLAVPQSTAAQAITDQLPEALDLAPGIVTISLGPLDVFDGVPAATYGAELHQLISALKGKGAVTVMVANTPPLSRLPAYQACLAGTFAASSDFTCPSPVPSPATVDAEVAASNAAVATQVAATGAILVDLHAADVVAQQQGTEASLISDDGVDPSTAGHAAIAKLFADALAASAHSDR
jgi:lysophospholipase L1-like esterase